MKKVNTFFFDFECQGRRPGAQFWYKYIFEMSPKSSLLWVKESKTCINTLKYRIAEKSKFIQHSTMTLRMSFKAIAFYAAKCLKVQNRPEHSISIGPIIYFIYLPVFCMI